MDRKQKPTITITELCNVIMRKPGTVRKWQSEGILPKHLIPHRNSNNHRLWTKDQVYGKGGIIDWMVDNDMRPGRLLSDPDNEEQHVFNLRRPKYLNGDQIRGVRKMVANGRSREYIIKKLYPRTQYTTEQALESALLRHFKRNGWEFPKKKRKPFPPPYLRLGQPGPKPKRGSVAAKRQAAAVRRRRRLVGF